MSNIDVYWTVIYASDVGVDVSLYTTRPDAVRGAVVTMLSMTRKIKDPLIKGEIFRQVEAGEYESALLVYGRAVTESFIIDAQPAMEMDEDTLSRALANEKKACS